MIYPNGLWESEDVLRFSSTGTPGSKIETDGDTEIVVKSIDEVCVDHPVGMIKMDIEGAELMALKGAYQTIKKHRPILAISVYHEPEDIKKIPEYILSVDDTYKLGLRHYWPCDWDTVLYAY